MIRKNNQIYLSYLIETVLCRNLGEGADVKKTAMIYWMGAIFFLLANAASAQDLKGKLPFKPDPARGHQTAIKLCTSCHLVDKEQIGTTQPGVPSFMQMANRPGQTSDKLATIMIHPFPPMIDTHLTTHEIKDISAYILSLKVPK